MIHCKMSLHIYDNNYYKWCTVIIQSELSCKYNNTLSHYFYYLLKFYSYNFILNMQVLALEGHWKFSLASWNEYVSSVPENWAQKERGGCGVATGCSTAFIFSVNQNNFTSRPGCRGGACGIFSISAIVQLLHQMQIGLASTHHFIYVIILTVGKKCTNTPCLS